MKQDKNELNERYICRAAITPADGQDYDFEAVAVPAQNGQTKYSYQNDEYFSQVLRTAEANIDISRLESGLPVFDNHPWETSAMNTLGITTGYIFDERGLVVRVKWGARADEALRSDVKNGILKTVSIEGTVQSYSIERKAGMIPVYYAEMWTPESLSIAPVPNDIGAQIEVKLKIDEQIAPKEINNSYKLLTSKF